MEQIQPDISYDTVIRDLERFLEQSAKVHDANHFYLLKTIPGVKKYIERIEKKHGNARAHSALATKLGRAIYFMLRRNETFDIGKLTRSGCDNSLQIAATIFGWDWKKTGPMNGNKMVLTGNW